MSTFAKAFRHELPKFCNAAGKKWGEAVIAKSVAEQTGDAETPLLLALLDNLAPASATQLAPESLVEACLEIQKSRTVEGKAADLRFIVPIVSSLEREKLLEMLPDFAKVSGNPSRPLVYIFTWGFSVASLHCSNSSLRSSTLRLDPSSWAPRSVGCESASPGSTISTGQRNPT